MSLRLWSLDSRSPKLLRNSCGKKSPDKFPGWWSKGNSLLKIKTGKWKPSPKSKTYQSNKAIFWIPTKTTPLQLSSQQNQEKSSVSTSSFHNNKVSTLASYTHQSKTFCSNLIQIPRTKKVS
jgi:hypothetical protein